MTLDALVEEAAAQSPAAAAAEAALAEARGALAKKTPLLPNPTVDVEAQSDVVTGNEGELAAGVALSQEIPFPGVRWAEVDAAELRVRAAAALRTAVVVGLRAEIAALVVELAALDEQRALLADVAATAARLDEAARRRAAAGAAPQVEANLAAVERVAADVALADVERALVETTARLCAVAGRASCAPIAASWSSLPAVAVSSSSVDELVERALASRAEIEAALLDVDAADREVLAAELDRIPVVALTAGYALERGVLDVVSVGRVVDEDHLLRVGVSIPIPLWNWGGGEVARARAEKQAADATLLRSRIDVAAEVRAAHARLDAAARAEERWAAVTPRVDEALGWIVKAYEAGASSIEAYLATRDRLVRARLDAVAARREKLLAAFLLERAVGGPVTQERTAMRSPR